MSDFLHAIIASGSWQGQLLAAPSQLRKHNSSIEGKSDCVDGEIEHGCRKENHIIYGLCLVTCLEIVILFYHVSYSVKTEQFYHWNS